MNKIHLLLYLLTHMDSTTMINQFTWLHYSQKKEKLINILESNPIDTEGDQSTDDLISFIHSLPDWSDQSLVDIYTSMILSWNEAKSNKQIIASIDKWMIEMNKYKMDLVQEKERDEADEILNNI